MTHEHPMKIGTGFDLEPLPDGTQFSATIDRLTEEERAWLTEQLDPDKGIHADSGNHDSDESKNGESRDFDSRDRGDSDDENRDDLDAGLQDLINELGGADFDFRWEFEADSLHAWNMEGSEESLDDIASLVQEFLAKFRPLESWWMLFAESGSGPVPNEITGGAVFVTAEDYEYLDGSQWVAEKLRESKGRETQDSTSVWKPITVYRSKCGCFMGMKDGKGKYASHAYVEDDGTWHALDLWSGFETAEEAMEAVSRDRKNPQC